MRSMREKISRNEKYYKFIKFGIMKERSDCGEMMSEGTGEPAPDIEVRLGAAVGDNEQIERLVRLERVLDDIDGATTTVIDVSTEETTER